MATETAAIPAPLVPAAALSPVAKGMLLGLVAVLIWGGYLAMARHSIGGGWSAMDLAMVRYVTAGLVMLPWLLRHGPATLAGVGWGRGLVLAALAGPGFILAGVGGYAFAPLAHGAVIQPAAVVLGGAALAAFVLGDRPGPARLAGIALMVVGLCLVAGPGLLGGGAQTPIGDALFVIAGLMWAGFGTLSRRWGVGAIAGTAAVSVISGAIMLPAYLLFADTGRLLAASPGELLTQVAVQGVLAGVVAVIAYSRAVQLLGPGRAAVFPALVPAAAIAIGIPVVGEIPALHAMAGLAVVTLGLLVALGVLRRA